MFVKLDHHPQVRFKIKLFETTNPVMDGYGIYEKNKENPYFTSFSTWSSVKASGREVEDPDEGRYA